MLYIYIYSMSKLTFIARAQNYVKWAEFSINHVKYRVVSGNSYKRNYKASNAFV